MFTSRRTKKEIADLLPPGGYGRWRGRRHADCRCGRGRDLWNDHLLIRLCPVPTARDGLDVLRTRHQFSLFDQRRLRRLGMVDGELRLLRRSIEVNARHDALTEIPNKVQREGKNDDGEELNGQARHNESSFPFRQA